MFELLTQIVLLVLVFFLFRFLFGFGGGAFVRWIGFGFLIVIIFLFFIDPGTRGAGVFWAILSFPLRPLGLSLILLSYALSQSFTWAGTKAINRAAHVMAAFLILIISSLPLTAYFLTAQGEQEVALNISQTSAGEVSAIVVLGNGTLPTNPAYRLRNQLSNAASGLAVDLESRLTYAAQLYSQQASQGRAPLVIVSPGPQAILARPGVTSTDAITAFLARLGVPTGQIRVETEGFDPRSSAVAVRDILLGDDCAIYAVCDEDESIGTARRISPANDTEVPIILVSPALIIRRAASTFIDLNFDVTPRPTDFFVFQIQGGARLAAFTDFIPNAEALSITTRAIEEYWTWIYYFARGWLSGPFNR